MEPVTSLVAACCALALLTFVVGIRMLYVRIGEMRRRGIGPQDVALSGQRAERLEDTRASDNYNHLFELPVLFYALAGLALATGHVPGWLAYAAWLFVALRVVHSLIQCTYNRVMHRFGVFVAGYGLLLVMWLAFAGSYLTA
ncbi:MAG TPA: MAPEG family protein [Woeseiaceae bacterium]|nr:MAPEG family protein [Woeseiaceae bacterium]